MNRAIQSGSQSEVSRGKESRQWRVSGAGGGGSEAGVGGSEAGGSQPH